MVVGLTVSVLLHIAFDPDQPLLPIQEIAFVVDHVRVVLAHEVIEVEDAEKLNERG